MCPTSLSCRPPSSIGLASLSFPRTPLLFTLLLQQKQMSAECRLIVSTCSSKCRRHVDSLNSRARAVMVRRLVSIQCLLHLDSYHTLWAKPATLARPLMPTTLAEFVVFGRAGDVLISAGSARLVGAFPWRLARPRRAGAAESSKLCLGEAANKAVRRNAMALSGFLACGGGGGVGGQTSRRRDGRLGGQTRRQRWFCSSTRPLPPA